MAKVLNAYNGFTATDISTRASNTCDMSVVSTTVECTNVKLSKVRTVLNGSTYSLYDLFNHVNVNHWSQFGPTVHTVTSSGSPSLARIVNTTPTAASLGSFAGYNHNAVTPGWGVGQEAICTAPILINPSLGGTVNLHAVVNIGEIDYGPTATSVNFVVWNHDTSAWIGTSPWKDIQECFNTEVNLTVSLGDMHDGTLYSCAVYITSYALEDTLVNPLVDGTKIISKVANMVAFEQSVVEMDASSVTVEHIGQTGTGFVMHTHDANPAINFSLVGGDAYFNHYHSTTSYTEHGLRLVLYNHLREELGHVSITNPHTPYTANTTIWGNDLDDGAWFLPNGTNLSSFGYYWVFEFTYGEIVPE